ncbi:MAG: DUF4912 domain-containing protein [Deltaproteobacteria bacterium]|nr:DUF4912 domain-containing protein [Deltaproteobacteria bacterium]MBI2974087.1 DUF4912 domain-containing protein [Deltaproteobacteria bacterium]
MAKTPKKSIRKVSKTKKPSKKVLKQTLVWKRTKPGRPKGKSLGKAKEKIAISKRNIEKPVFQNTTELQVEESKFNLGVRQNNEEFHVHNLPFGYGNNRIILLIVDPKFAFVYWDVQPEKMNDALSAIGHNAKLTLRFTQLNTKHSWDVSIYERIGNWYLRLNHPENELIVKIGMKNENGDFYKIASSNIMRFPRTGLAGRGPTKWMLVSPSGEKVTTEIEEYTNADLELLKKILGPYFFDLFSRGKFATLTGSSAENVFMNFEEIQKPAILS